MLFVGCADNAAIFVIHERKANSVRDVAVLKLRGAADIERKPLTEKKESRLKGVGMWLFTEHVFL